MTAIANNAIAHRPVTLYRSIQSISGEDESGACTTRRMAHSRVPGMSNIQDDVVLISESDDEKTRKPKRSKKDDQKNKSKPKVRNPSLTLHTGIR